MMEGLLTESISEQAVKRVIEKNLMPSIDKIDSSICDDETVRFSIEKTASKLENNYVNADNNCRLDGTLIENYPATKKEITSKEKAKKILMSELLKHWKPKGKSVLN
jgi:hypothetical protein